MRNSLKLGFLGAAALAATAMPNVASAQEISAIKDGIHVIMGRGGNIGVSVAEDTMVLAGLAAAVFYPVEFLIFLALFMAVAIWLLPKIWRGVKFVFARIRQAFGGDAQPQPPSGISLKQIPAQKGAQVQGGV